MSELSNVSTEALKNEVRVRQAQEQAKELHTKGVAEFKRLVAGTSDSIELGKIAGNFASKVNRIRLILNPQAKRKSGRKPKD